MFKILTLFFKTILFFAIILSLIAIYARYIEPYRLVSTTITVTNENAAPNSDDVTIALFSDTHFSDYYTPKNFEKVIKTINDKKPDIILFCGDLIDNYKEYDGDVEEIVGALARLDAPMGKFGVYGNHDHGGGAERAYPDVMERGGFEVFKNAYIVLDDWKLTLIGIDDFLLGDGDTEFVRDAAADGYFNLVFCHEPDIADALLDYRVNFMTAGHTHGGQINLFGYKHIFFPPYGQKYIKGSYTFENEANTTLYVNPGIGTTKLPFRLMATPEVTFITISY